MTNRASFNDDEWDVLMDTLREPAIAVMASSPGGFIKEVFGYGRAIHEAHATFQQSEFILALLHDMPPEAGAAIGEAAHTAAANHDAHVAELATLLQHGVAIVARQATPQELSDYKQLVFYLADQVARSAKEGGVFGLGGVLISPAEQRVLDVVQKALEE